VTTSHATHHIRASARPAAPPAIRWVLSGILAGLPLPLPFFGLASEASLIEELEVMDDMALGEKEEEEGLV
jgi:hypothetical protein